MRVTDQALKVEYLYYTGFSIFLLQYLLSYTNFSSIGLSVVEICNGLKILAFILIFIKLLLQKYIFRSLILLLFSAVICLISLYYTFDQQLIVLFVFIISSQNISIKSVAKISLIVTTAITLLTVLCTFLGVIPSTDIFTADGEFAQSMGFVLPNRFGAALFAICFSVTIINFPKVPLGCFFVDILGILLCHFIARSNTSLIGIILTLILSIFASRCISLSRERIFLNFGIISFICCIFFSLFCMLYYTSNNPVLSFLDKIFTGRFELANRYFNLFSTTLFGRRFNEMSYTVGNYTTLVVDNAYAKLFIQIGIIPAIFFILLYVISLYHATRLNLLNAEVFGIIVFIFIALSESYAFHFCINYCMIFFSWFFIKNVNYLNRKNISCVK